ncbi:MAG: 2'-5' RNA ligase family protein [Clostridia bacterium]|nr:2'-5' RNA ligase family protein [Clostridia bacterium]
MFIWIGCDINPKFIEYREKVKEFNADLNLSETALNLPQHISLKITFEMQEEIAKHCIKDIIELLKSAKPFTAKVEKLELHDGGILWLRVEENEQFKTLHDELDQIAISYAVKPHAFDKQFIYHSTVIMDENAEKLSTMFERLKDIPYPDELKINTFLVGTSEDNVNFKVVRRIKVK